MATKKISELNTLTTPESDDLIAIVDASATETKKITYGNISKHIVNVGTEVEEYSRINFIHSRNIIDSSNFQSGAYSMSNGNYTEYGTRVCTINKIPVEPSTKYAITMNTTTSYSFLMIIDAYSEDGTYLGRISANNGNTSGTYVQTQATAKYINITMRDTTDSQVLSSSFLQYLSNGSLQIQLVKGETSLDYEPYTTNSINVDNETFSETIKIGNKVDGKSRVNVLKSKNLWNYNSVISRLGVTSTYDNSTLTLNGTSSGEGFNIPYMNMMYLKAGTYTFSVSSPSGTKTGEQSIVLRNQTATTNLLDTTLNIASGNTYTFTLSNDAYVCVLIYFRTGNQVFTNFKLNIQIEKGSTATTYEPYIAPSIIVNNDTIYQEPVVLYDGGDIGSDLSSAISFSDSLVNYERIEIYYGTSRPYYISTFYSNYGQHQYFEPSLQFYYLNNADSSFYIYITLLTFSQSAMELHGTRGSRTVTISSDGTITNTKSTTSSTIKIYKVIGYK